MTEQTQELDAKDYKILVYRQRVSEMEDQIADLRIEVTMLSSELDRYKRSEDDNVEVSEEK
jgi:hypothetical protein